jgi:hypothetical protein
MTNAETKMTALLQRIGLDANAAAELLSLAADHLENRQALPPKVADFLATSIRNAVAEPSANRAHRLTFELGLSAPAKEGRPASDVDYQELCRIIDEAFSNDDGESSETKLKAVIAKRFGISETTALKHLKPAMLVPQLLKHNGIESLIPPRPSPKGE